MLMEKIEIKNFRGIKQLNLELEEGVTVLIGENNTGKSTILEAMQACLSGYRFPSREVFLEYDYHMTDTDDRPTESEPIEIVLHFVLHSNETDAMRRMEKTLQIDNERTTIALRVGSTYNGESSTEPTWEFLNRKGEELRINGQFHRNILRRLVPVFYLKALRDADREFKPNSKFWKPFVRSLNIDVKRRKELENELSAVNKQVIDMHTSFDAVKNNLKKIAEMIPPYNQDPVTIQAIPDRMFDVLSRAQIMLTSATGADIPLRRHGEGMQSLAVVCLFTAFLSSKLIETYEKYASPILAIEEPEAHLHPSAILAVIDILENMDGQKIVTTHSGDMIAGIPMESLRRLHRKDGAITVNQINKGAFNDEEMRKIKYHVSATRGNLLFARYWLLVEGETDRMIFERCSAACGYDIMRYGIYCVEYATSNLTTLLKFANQLGIEWSVVADGDGEGGKYAKYAQKCLEGRDESRYVYRLEYDNLELLLCMDKYGEYYERNVLSDSRLMTPRDITSKDYWRSVCQIQSSKAKMRTAAIIADKIRIRNDVPKSIQRRIDQMVSIVEAL